MRIWVMARMQEVSIVFRRVGFFTFCARVWRQLGQDSVYTWGAAMAYSWLFATFPFLVFLLSLVPLVPARFKPDVRHDVFTVVNDTLPSDASSLVMKQVDSVLDAPSARGFLSFGLVLTLWAASGGMSMTMSALDKAYDMEKVRPYWKQRLLAIVLMAICASLLILVMVLLPVGTGVLTWLVHRGQIFSWLYYLINVVRYVIALLLMFTILAILYHFGTCYKQKFHPVTPGAVFTVAVWLILGVAFKLYLTKFGGAANYNRMYGAVAGAAILLLFFYIDSLTLLVGAEINSEIDFAMTGHHGDEFEPPEPLEQS
jgi:membrane protein